MKIDLTPIQKLADSVVELYRKQLEEGGVSTSREPIRAIVEFNGDQLLISFELNDYWKYVEYGRKPGKMPPVDSIADWIKIKRIIPEPINGKIPDTKQLAFLIARKIGRDGVEGKHIMNKTIHSNQMNSIINDIKKEIMNQLKQQFIDEWN
jgi:hypothetical protein